MVNPAFGIAGIILILGFLGDYLFKKKGVPDVLILILLGYILGPLLHIIEPSVLAPLSPLFTSLALLLILFDGGLHLNLKKVFQQSPRAFSLACLSMGTSILITTIFTSVFMGMDLMRGILLGSIIGGTSSSIVIPLISRIQMKEKVKTLLSLESVFTDAMVIVFSLTLIQMISTPTGNEFFMAARGLASAFSIGAVMGVLVGVIWLKVLRWLKGEVYDDILTLSMALLFYWVVENLGGNGAIFALSFGLVLGNGKEISSFLGMKDVVEAGAVMKKFHSEISFFIKTFFFVYLGLITSLTDMWLILQGFVLTSLLLIGRMFAAYVTAFHSRYLRESVKAIGLMFPRGLSAAIATELAVMRGALQPYLSEMVIIVILSSVLLSSILSSFLQRKFNKNLNKEEKKNKR